MPRRQVPLALRAHCSLNRLAERALGPVGRRTGAENDQKLDKGVGIQRWPQRMALRPSFSAGGELSGSDETHFGGGPLGKVHSRPVFSFNFSS